MARVVWGRHVEALRLYRAILRRGRQLKYTDGDYFKRSVRREFEKKVNPDQISFRIEVLIMQTINLFYNL